MVLGWDFYCDASSAPFLGQLPTYVCYRPSVPDAPASESAKAPEMKARRPRSSLPPVLGTESEYLPARLFQASLGLRPAQTLPAPRRPRPSVSPDLP